MFGPLGIPEILFILVLALLIFGPKRLPDVGRTVGKAMGEFRRASTELRRTLNTEIALAETGPPSERRPAVQRNVEVTPAPPALPDPGPGDAPAPDDLPAGVQARGAAPAPAAVVAAADAAPEGAPPEEAGAKVPV